MYSRQEKHKAGSTNSSLESQLIKVRYTFISRIPKRLNENTFNTDNQKINYQSNRSSIILIFLNKYFVHCAAAVSRLTATAPCTMYFVLHINSVEINFVQLFDILKLSIIFPFNYPKILFIKVNPLSCNLNIGLTKQ